MIPPPKMYSAVCWWDAARCSGGRRRPRSQLRVDQGSDLTTRQCESERGDYWTSLPATTKKLGCFGYIPDLLRSLLGWGKLPKITATGGARVMSHRWALWKQRGRLRVFSWRRRLLVPTGVSPCQVPVTPRRFNPHTKLSQPRFGA
jgi:hypothetical protein